VSGLLVLEIKCIIWKIVNYKPMPVPTRDLNRNCSEVISDIHFGDTLSLAWLVETIGKQPAWVDRAMTSTFAVKQEVVLCFNVYFLSWCALRKPCTSMYINEVVISKNSGEVGITWRQRNLPN
jgi:hypothetical protein